MSPKEKKEGSEDISMTLAEEAKTVFTRVDQASKSGEKLTTEDIYEKKSQLKKSSTEQQRIIAVCGDEHSWILVRTSKLSSSWSYHEASAWE
ncbi:hypothetical protein KIN20_014116 [Parelaphostrongylus tenuis]|uniref:Uncharacterized protein n=1 Tax=Parelaphostrongylus tenuis TaxID=148309 RepID=A0AAD5MVH4_PARTN|nr:hypothetical protein KIN20_014116 [Parelaphostrongylus tenuis]